MVLYDIDTLLLISFMAEETAVLGRVVFGQGRFPLGGMARLTEFFRLFLVHFHERRMVIIVWQMFGGLFRGVEEKEEKAAANDNKYQVVQKNIFAFGFLFVTVH